MDRQPTVEELQEYCDMCCAWDCDGNDKTYCPYRINRFTVKTWWNILTAHTNEHTNEKC